MHLLPCPHCHASITVSPTQAGETTKCPSCQAAVAIPKLGELRGLPLAEPERASTSPIRSPGEERPRSWQFGFGLAGFIAAASLLVAGFCGLRWALIEVPATTEEHVATIREELGKRTAAELVREYEDMEKRGIDLGLPFNYKRTALTKARWGRNASIAASIGAVAILTAIALAGKGRRNQP